MLRTAPRRGKEEPTMADMSIKERVRERYAKAAQQVGAGA